MAHLKLFVLGHPRLERDGKPTELNLRKALALLVYLAMSGQPHGRDALATLLWPESDGREGRARLRRTLHRLTQTIGDEILDIGPETIRLYSHADLWLDCVAFRQQATAGLSAAQDVFAPERLAHLNAALELYTEDFLAGFTLPDSTVFDEWQFFQREGLRQLYGQVLEQLVQAYRSQQLWGPAVVYARRWLALDGLHEPAHRMLMRLYAWSGQHAAALRQYQECIRILDAELGVVPEAETTALYDAIRTRQLDPPAAAQLVVDHVRANRLVPAEQPGHLVARVPDQRGDDPSHTPHSQQEDPLFVARQGELRWLDTLLEAAREGQHSVAFVVGEAGQGKTALLRTFARLSHTAHPELMVAWGSCNAYAGVGDPYLPFRAILELLSGNAEVDVLGGGLHQDHADRLLRLAPVAAQALVDVGPGLLDTFIPTRGLLRRANAYAGAEAAWVAQLQELASQTLARPTDPRQQALFEQYARVIESLARHSTLLLIMDDLQWADVGSTDLLLHLGRRLKGCRVLIVGAYRPADVAIGRDGERHPLERVVGELQRGFGEIRLDLGQAEGRPLVDALLDSEPNQLDEAFRSALYQQTDGHPLFTIELLRDMQERGELARDAAGRWTALPHLHWNRLPARVEGVIGERIGRLDARLREILQLASVEGEEFTAEVVARVVGADEHELVRQLSRDLNQMHHLVRALGVRREDGLRLSRYRFQHIVIQRYLYHSLDDVERVYQHEAIGHALEVLYGTRVAEIAAQLAWHFEAAQLPAKAATYCDQAGDQARRSAALAEAVRCYQMALGAWPTSDPTGRAKLLRKLGECQMVRGQMEDALPPLEASYALYELLGDQKGAGALQRLIGRLYWEQGDRERSLRHYYEALALLESGQESVELAWAISSIAQMHMLGSAHDQAITWGQRAFAMAERLEAEHAMIHSLTTLGNASILMGDAERGQAMLRRSWWRAVELHLAPDACRAALLLGKRMINVGLTAEARAILEEVHTFAVHMEMPMFAGGSAISLAELDWLTGHWQSALTRRAEIMAWIGRGQSIVYLEVVASSLFAWMHNDLGQAELARQMLEQAQPKVVGRAEIQTTGPHLGQQVRALWMLGFEDEATETAQLFLELLDQQQYHWDNPAPYLAVCSLLARRAPEMRVERDASLAQLERADAQLGSPMTAVALSEGRGLVALCEGDALRAIEHFRHAASQWQVLGCPYDQARALNDLGRALIETGDEGQASTTLDSALSLIGTLAAQIEDRDLKEAFLSSPLVQEIRVARASVEATTPTTAR